MKLIDTVRLATTTSDGYGDKSVTILTDVKSLFIQKSSVSHANNTDTELSDATVYLDATNEVVLANMFKLEGMYIIAQPFGQNMQDSWYKIKSVSVGQRKLLDNDVDNIHCTLQKVAGLAYAPVS